MFFGGRGMAEDACSRDVGVGDIEFENVGFMKVVIVDGPNSLYVLTWVTRGYGPDLGSKA
jgi:hypothetical protein